MTSCPGRISQRLTVWVPASASKWESGLRMGGVRWGAVPCSILMELVVMSWWDLIFHTELKWAFSVSSTRLTPEVHIVHLIEASNSAHLVKNRTMEPQRQAGNDKNDRWLASRPEWFFFLSVNGRCQFFLPIVEYQLFHVWEGCGGPLNHGLQMPEWQKESHMGKRIMCVYFPPFSSQEAENERMWVSRKREAAIRGGGKREIGYGKNTHLQVSSETEHQPHGKLPSECFAFNFCTMFRPS